MGWDRGEVICEIIGEKFGEKGERWIRSDSRKLKADPITHQRCIKSVEFVCCSVLLTIRNVTVGQDVAHLSSALSREKRLKSEHNFHVGRKLFHCELLRHNKKQHLLSRCNSISFLLFAICHYSSCVWCCATKLPFFFFSCRLHSSFVGRCAIYYRLGYSQFSLCYSVIRFSHQFLFHSHLVCPSSPLVVNIPKTNMKCGKQIKYLSFDYRYSPSLFTLNLQLSFAAVRWASLVENIEFSHFSIIKSRMHRIIWKTLISEWLFDFPLFILHFVVSFRWFFGVLFSQSIAREKRTRWYGMDKTCCRGRLIQQVKSQHE